MQDLKPAVFAQNLPANSLIRFSEDFGGETNMYQGFDVNVDARFRNGAFVKAGIAATARTFDNCNLLAAGLDAVSGLGVGSGQGASVSQGTEIYPDGSTACHREYGYRPDFKTSGSYTLPWDIQLAGTYPVQPRHPERRRRPEPERDVERHQRAGRVERRAYLDERRDSRTINLIREGSDYGKHNLNQLDIKLAKRFTIDRVRLRVDFDLYNVFNSSWPYTVTTTYSNCGDRHVAAADERAAASLLQAGRQYQLLTISEFRSEISEDCRSKK